MNGRSYPAAATAVDRTSGPVLAWNVEPTQFPAGTYPEMPTAAAAAVSPVVPAAAATAAPPDPYGRCWQNQVDPSACFPYFGTLYGTSLPPPSYRMQPGCLSNLGQFWPPTPPPEGCVRYDGANNLHYCPPLTPVFRHGESLQQNMLGVQRLGHYSHLVDINKDTGLKRLDACLDGMQRQKVLLGSSKHCKEAVHQRLCSCYECNEKNFSRATPQSVNKENIGSKLLEQKYPDDKLKARSCRKGKEDTYPYSRSTVSYHPNASAISNYTCPMDPNLTRTTSSMQAPTQSDCVAQAMQKFDSPVSSSNGCVQREFVRPEANAFHSIRCASNSLMTMAPSKDITQVVHSAVKTNEQPRFDTPAEKAPRHRLQGPTSAYESCPCPQVQTPSSSTSHRSTTGENSCCFSPPYVSSRTLYHNYPESSAHSKTPNMLMMYGNGFNASPLKNVYFSYYESENFDMGSGSANRKSRGNFGKVEKMSSMGNPDNQVITPVNSQSNYISSRSNGISNHMPSGKFSRAASSDKIPVSADTYGCVYQSSCIEQHKGTNSAFAESLKQPMVSSYVSHMPKFGSVHIKQEKVETMDCKFQKARHGGSSSSSRIPPLPDTVVSNGVLNLSTSIRCPKIEPYDQMNLGSVESASTFLALPLSSSVADSAVQSVTLNAAHTSQSLKPDNLSSSHFPSHISSAHLKCHEVPDATTPQMHELVSDCAPAVPEDLCPMPQIAPYGGAELPIMGKMPTTGYEAPIQVVCHTEASAERTASRSGSDESEAVHHLSSKRNSLPPGHHSTLSFDEVIQMKEIANYEANTYLMKESSALPVDSVSEASPCKPEKSDNLCSVQDGNTTILMYVKSEDTENYSENTADVHSSESASPNCSRVLNFEIPQLKLCDVKEEVEEKPIDEVKGEDLATEECNGLYVLLQGIAHKNTIGSPTCQPTVSEDKDEAEKMQPLSIDCSTGDISCPSSSGMKGLSLLCALAEKQFLMEFGEKEGSCAKEVGVCVNLLATLSSNYPSVKEELMPEANSSTDENEEKKESLLAAEIKMRKRLAELQQIYKEKQKELARLRPKKSRHSNGSEVPNSPSGTVESSLNSSQSSNSSRETDETSPVKDNHVLEIDFAVKDATSEDDQKSEKDHNKAANEVIDISDSGSTSAESVLQVDESGIEVDPDSNGQEKPALKRSMRRRKIESREASRKSRCCTRQRSTRGNSSARSALQTESDTSDENPKASRKRKKPSKEKSYPMCLAGESDQLKMELSEDVELSPVPASTRSPKKRKAENPKKFLPSKQVRLTETIVTKQLRNRMLFESPECFPTTPDEKPYDVPEALFDALRKCHLGENSQNEEENGRKSDVERTVSPPMPDLGESMEQREVPKIAPKPLKMTVDYLRESQRILAIEDGLFYAGSIREVQSADVFSVVLDGQRGNKKHLFSLDEMLSQTILEVKPISLHELPEGTRVCAYWSHQYRCLYPGTVVRAPAPSVDWSEPRVFVEFDDGDSAQIAMKNIRFLPSDMKFSEDNEARDCLTGISPFESKGIGLEVSRSNLKSKRRAAKELGRCSKMGTPDFSNSKAINNCSNDSNPVEDCEPAPPPCPSQRLDGEPVEESTSELDAKASKRIQRQRSKQRLGGKTKLREGSLQPEKSKKHKKYKDRHKHHHHHRHHHRHHRHCHHHRHCKKRKHHKRTSSVDDIINVVIPSNSIPFSNLVAKSTRSSMKDAEAQCVGHSKRESKQLPQPNGEVGDSKSLRGSPSKKACR